MNSNTYLTRNGLHHRGWTKRQISALLGEPDRRCVNPYRRAGPPIHLFLTGRVEAAEASASFRAAHRRREARAARAARGPTVGAALHTALLREVRAELARDEGSFGQAAGLISATP